MGNSEEEVTIQVVHNVYSNSIKQLSKCTKLKCRGFQEIASKQALIRFLVNSGLELQDKKSTVQILRKSKKHGSYVSLDSESDFKHLARSLMVKSRIKLLINDSNLSGSSSDLESGETKLEKELASSMSLGDTDSLPKENHCSSNPNRASSSDIVHEGTICDGCNPEDTDTIAPLKGIRYKCLVCEDFDLCEACEARCHEQGITMGNHSNLHAMLKIVDPKEDVRSFLSQRDTNSFRNVEKSDFYDMFYDIPLEECGEETKVKIEKALSSEGVVGFFHKVDKYVKNSERYEELVSLLTVEDENDSEDNDELMFARLKSLIELNNTSKIAPEDKDIGSKENGQNAFSDVNEMQKLIGDVIITPKKVGSSSRLISLTLKNTSEATISGGNLKFRFFNAEVSEVISIKNANSIRPGKQRFYNLGSLGDKYDQLPDLNVEITSDSHIMQGSYSSTDSSTLTLQARNAGKIVEENTSSSVLGENDLVKVTMVPKSNSMSSVIIHNKSSKKIDLSEVKLEVVNYLGTAVSSVPIRKSYGIAPGKVSKFNIALVNTHMKYPFKLVLRSDLYTGVCELSHKCLSGNLKFSQNGQADGQDHSESELRGSIELKSDTESIDEDVEKSEVSGNAEPISDKSKNSQTSSIHSIVLPSLPRELMLDSVQSISEYLDAKSSDSEGIEKRGVFGLEDGEEDYDIISVEGEDNYSDYEMLSPSFSNQ